MIFKIYDTPALEDGFWQSLYRESFEARYCESETASSMEIRFLKLNEKEQRYWIRILDRSGCVYEIIEEFSKPIHFTQE